MRPLPRPLRHLLLAALAACTGGDAAGGDAARGGSTAAAAAPQVVRAAVAANLRDAFDELAAAYAAADPGVTVQPTYTASGVAYQQILAGAPFDLLVSADSAYPAALDSAGRAEPGTRRTYARGTLALWTSARIPDDVRDLRGLTSRSVRRVAVANPETAPYGRAALEALGRAGVLDQVRPKLAYGQDAAQAAQVALAGADAALLPLSVVRSGPLAEAGAVHPVPDSLHAPIAQALVVVRGAGEPARRFAGFMTSTPARAVLERHGYRAP